MLTKKLRDKHNSSFVNITPCWRLFAFLRSDKCLLNVYHYNIVMKTAHQTHHQRYACVPYHAYTNVINTFNYHLGTSVDILINYIPNRFTFE